MKRTKRNIFRKYFAIVIALLMVIQTVHISGLVSRAADEEITITDSTTVVNITDSTKTYSITGTSSGDLVNSAIVIDVGAGNTVNVSMNSVIMQRKDTFSNSAIIQVRSGNVVFSYSGDNSFIAVQNSGGRVRKHILWCTGSPDRGIYWYKCYSGLVSSHAESV